MPGHLAQPWGRSGLGFWYPSYVTMGKFLGLSAPLFSCKEKLTSTPH